MNFCDECGREILCDAELGRVDERRQNIAGHRHTTKTTLCKDCVEDEAEVMQKIANSPEAEIEIFYDRLCKVENQLKLRGSV